MTLRCALSAEQAIQLSHSNEGKVTVRIERAGHPLATSSQLAHHVCAVPRSPPQISKAHAFKNTKIRSAVNGVMDPKVLEVTRCEVERTIY